MTFEEKIEKLKQNFSLKQKEQLEEQNQLELDNLAYEIKKVIKWNCIVKLLDKESYSGEYEKKNLVPGAIYKAYTSGQGVYVGEWYLLPEQYKLIENKILNDRTN